MKIKDTLNLTLSIVGKDVKIVLTKDRRKKPHRKVIETCKMEERSHFHLYVHIHHYVPTSAETLEEQYKLYISIHKYIQSTT
jgi:hypothetical protein